MEEEKKEKKLNYIEPVYGPDIFYPELLNPDESQLADALGISNEREIILREGLQQAIKESSEFKEFFPKIQPYITHVNDLVYLCVTLGIQSEAHKHVKKDIKSGSDTERMSEVLKEIIEKHGKGFGGPIQESTRTVRVKSPSPLKTKLSKFDDLLKPPQTPSASYNSFNTDDVIYPDNR